MPLLLLGYLQPNSCTIFDEQQRDMQGFYIGETRGMNVAWRLRTWACLVLFPSVLRLHQISGIAAGR